ncbi:lytic transglycosylase domain-containing protein [soil metagenome]
MIVIPSVVEAGPCLAQVIEISSDGAATTYAGPSVFTLEGAQTIGASAGLPPSLGAANVTQLIADAARRHDVSVDLIKEVARRESGFRQSAVSTRDAVGVMQLTAGTARELGVDRYDVSQNILGGAAYLRRMLNRYDGDVRLALAAYNAGPGAVDRYRGVPPFQETNAYVAAILTRLAQHALADTVLTVTGR